MSTAKWCAALLCCAAMAASADDAAVAPVQLDPVVVTATREARSAFDVPASIDALTGDAIQRGVPGVNLSELLQAIPGLQMRDRQNYAQDLQLSIRGFGTRAPFGIVGSKLYIDGIPATMPDGQGQVSHANLDTAERIEVLRGPFSALYGNAAGGVVQIFSAPGEAPSELIFESVGGSYGQARASLNSRGARGALSWNAGYTGFRTDGFREHSAARRHSANALLGFGSDPRMRASVVANVLALPEAEDPLGLTRAQFEADPRQSSPNAKSFNTRKRVDQAQLGSSGMIALGATQDLFLSAYYGQREVEQVLAIPVATQANALHSGGVVDLDNDYFGAELRWAAHWRLGAQQISLSTGLALDRQDSHRQGYENFQGSELGVRGALRRDEDNRITSLDPYVQASWEPGPHWMLLAGARRSSVRFASADHYVTGANPDDSGGVKFADLTPVAGLQWRALDSLHLHAAYGEGFDSPTFAELAYRPDGLSGLNTAVKPMRTRSGELGLKWRAGFGLVANTAVFLAETRDEIVIATAQGGRQTYQNAGRARRQGFELGLSAPLAAKLKLNLAATLVDARFRDAYLTCAGRFCPAPNTQVPSGTRVPGVVRSGAQLALRYGAGADVAGWNAALVSDYASRVAVNSANSEFASSYVLASLDGGYAWELSRWRLRLYARVANVFDRDYAGSVIVNDANGQYYEPGPGRSGFAGIELHWRTSADTQGQP